MSSTSTNEEPQVVASALHNEEDCPVTEALGNMALSFAESLEGIRDAFHQEIRRLQEAMQQQTLALERRLQQAMPACEAPAGGRASWGVEMRMAPAGGHGRGQSEVLRVAEISLEEDPWERMATSFALSLLHVREAFHREKLRSQQHVLAVLRTENRGNNDKLEDSVQTAVSCVFPKVDRLLDEIDKRWPPHSVPQNNALLKAALEGNAQRVLWLVNDGVDVNCRGCSTLRTPLHMAAGGGHDPVVRLLASRGANLNARSASGHTPLHHAVLLDPSGRCVAQLVALGADVNKDDRDGVTPLRMAQRLRRIEAFTALTEGGARE